MGGRVIKKWPKSQELLGTVIVNAYTEILKAWFVVNGVTEDNKASEFLAVVGLYVGMYWHQGSRARRRLTRFNKI